MESTNVKTSVVGIGGAGCIEIDRIIEIDGGEMPYINTIAIDTDLLAISQCKAKKKILIGKEITKGRGSGGKFDIGEKAAKESKAAIKEAINDSNIVLIISGFGGGTGSGASSVIAQIAEELNKLTIVVYIMPYNTEEQEIIKRAQEASDNINKLAVAYLRIDKERLLQTVSNDVSNQATYSSINDIIRNLIKLILIITDTNKNSLSSLDLADLETVLKSSGKFFLGTGTSTIMEGAMLAYKRAIDNSIFGYSIDNAVNLIVHISGNENLKMNDINSVLKSIIEKTSEDAFILNGCAIEKSDNFIVSIIATFEREKM